ncbi:sugar transferase [Flavobacterium cerinum]|uniref:Sugar transferase n=1 Tax=Flavobacterium cerinum TaxID=2502784 RepID=A0ABY5J0C8_9FLAO|nr:sugar transferase [Flavobacterium cerinum]UUC47029.1 sugar transferase [Flavobacterium cerinum]
MIKRLFDIVFALLLLIAFSGILVLTWLISAWATRSGGIFLQQRIGQYGKPFTIIKLKTMRFLAADTDQVKAIIPPVSAFFRKYKLDELPQLINILIGQMSFVGPRPDIPGYYDKLIGDERKILELKPGLTSEASIKYSNEEEILKNIPNPEKFNDEVIFPDKIKMNLHYYYNRSFIGDLKVIFNTLLRFC